MKTAADFLSRTEVNPVKNFGVSIRKDIQTNTKDGKIQSLDIVEDEQIYILSDDDFAENKP